MDFEIEDFNGVYAEIYEKFGEEFARKIHIFFKGQQVTFPIRLYSKDYVIRYIQENYNGTNLKQLSRELNYTERWIKSLINEYKIK